MNENIVENIKAYLTKENMSTRTFEKLAGAKIGTISHLLAGRIQNPTVKTLKLAADVMGCEVQDLFSDCREKKKVSKSSKITHPEILSQTLSALIELSDFEKIDLDNFMDILKEIYLYSISKRPPEVDVDFVKWYLKKGEQNENK